MSTIWRFYRNSGRWRWQRLNMDRSVEVEAPAGFSQYQDCVADARKNGFRSAPYDIHNIEAVRRRR